MKYPICLILALAICLPVQAQQNAVKVVYSRQMPRSVRATAPRSIKSKFFGVCRLGSTKSDLLLHFYQLPAKKDDSQNVPEAKNYFLDLFTRVGNKAKKVRRLNSIHFSSRSDFDTVIVDIIWADPKRQQIPIVRIDLRVSKGFYGPFGSEVLFAFAKGFEHKPSIKEFDYGGNFTFSSDTSYEDIDQKGFMVIERTVVDNPSSEGAAGRTSVAKWYWNGEKFTPKKDEKKEEEK